MISESHLREDLIAADHECTQIMDELQCAIHKLDIAPIPSSDAEGELRGYARTCRIFVKIYRTQFHVQRAIECLRVDKNCREEGSDA